VRTSTIVMVGFAVVFGLLAVFLANAWLNNRAAQTMRDLAAQQKTAPPAHTLVVAAKPLKFGDVITSSSLREISWPDDAVPQGAFAKIGELTAGKRVVLIPIAVNEPILASNITGPGQRGTLSSLLKDGMKAVTIRVNDVGDVGGFVLPGDHVDVVLTRPGDRKVSVTDVVLQDVRVLGVDQMADNTADKPAVVKAVTLEVDEAGGQKLALASMVGTLSLLLRKAGETKDDQARQISPLDLANRTGPHGTSQFTTIVVTRVAKDSMSLDQYSVPIEGSNNNKYNENAHSAALPAPQMAHE
jgi:pilus assembly protein CpaB